MTKPKFEPEVPVAVNQLWIDNDRRNRARRFLRVHEVTDTHAIGASWYDEPGGVSRAFRIRLSRFRPTSTGYRLAPNQEEV